MATAAVSSAFIITVTGDTSAGSTFTAPRAFTVVAVTAQNTAAAASTLTITNAGTAFTGTTAAPPVAGAAVIEAQADSQGMSNVNIIAANANVALGAAVVVTAGDATVTPVMLHCVANGLGEAIAVT